MSVVTPVAEVIVTLIDGYNEPCGAQLLISWDNDNFDFGGLWQLTSHYFDSGQQYGSTYVGPEVEMLLNAFLDTEYPSCDEVDVRLVQMR